MSQELRKIAGFSEDCSFRLHYILSLKRRNHANTPSKFKFHQMRIESVEAMLCLRAALVLLTLVEGKFREERISKQQLWF